LPEVTTIETLSSAPSEPQNPDTKAKTYSLTRRMVAAVVACQLMLAIGLLLAAVLYWKSESLLAAGSAGMLILLATILFARGIIRRGFDPVRELAERTWEISAQNLNFPHPSDEELAEELSPLVHGVETLLGRIKTSIRQQREFTGNSAHEWKTSLAIMKSSLQSLRHRPRSQREYELGLEGLLHDCSRLEDLLAKMLRLARIEQVSESGVRRYLGLTDLKITCETAISRMDKMAEERNVTLDLENSDSTALRADPEDLELIWMNLLENAIQFSPPGATVKMRVQSAEKSGVEISVLDAGPGIPTVELPYIFERFHRADPSPATSPGGFGLGLAICKALVESYGGTIEAFNLPKRGAELRVRLPGERK
jgi:signal transduction histidine kinase